MLIHKSLRTSIAYLLLLLIAFKSYGQSADSTINTAIDTATTNISLAGAPRDVVKKSDTIVKPKLAFQPKPKKAGLYSAIIPGTGQLYNRQYWKVPIVYAGAFAAGYFFNYNLKNYNKYRKLYLDRLANPNAPIPADEPYDTEGLKNQQDQYRRFLDMTALFSALGYTLQVIDAVASAHLRNFDVSRDISMQFRPVVEPYYVGVGLVVNVK